MGPHEGPLEPVKNRPGSCPHPNPNRHPLIEIGLQEKGHPLIIERYPSEWLTQQLSLSRKSIKEPLNKSGRAVMRHKPSNARREASAPAHAPYLRPCRQNAVNIRNIDKFCALKITDRKSEEVPLGCNEARLQGWRR
jgi:hypothetical protein